MQGQVFLKGGGAGGELTLFLFEFFQGLSFWHLEIILPFPKLCYTFEEKLFFSVTIIMEKDNSNLSKNEPESIS